MTKLTEIKKTNEDDNELNNKLSDKNSNENIVLTNQKNDDNEKNYCDNNKNNINNTNNLEKKSILTSNGSVKNSTLPKKSVSFTNNNNISNNNSSIPLNNSNIEKFIVGDIIIDQQNPFKTSNSFDSFEIIETNSSDGQKKKLIKIKSPPTVLNDNDDDDDDGSEFITTAEVLRQSKCVKTYVKNPDPYFKINKEEIERILSEDETDCKRILNVKPSNLVKPKPITRTKFLNSTSNKDSVKDNYSHLKKAGGTNTKKTKIKQNGIKYPDLSQLKVKIGAEPDEKLHNPIEVAINVRKFDDRFKNVHLGSQDDLDEIAELTDSENVKKEPETKEVDTVKPNKSFTNTVTSEEFQEFLKKNHLKLQVETPNLKFDSIIEKSSEKEIIMDKKEESPTKKKSVFGRLLSGGIFAKSSKTTPKEQVPTPQSLYKNSTATLDYKKPTPIKRVVLERQSYHGIPTQYQRPKPPVSSQKPGTTSNSPDNPINLQRVKPIRRSLRTDQISNLSQIRQNYQDIEAIPKPKRTNSIPTKTNQNSVEQMVYRNVDPKKINSIPVLKQSTEISTSKSSSDHRPMLPIPQQQLKSSKKIKPPVPVRRTSALQTPVSRHSDVNNIYGNIESIEQAVNNTIQPQSVQAQVKISRTPVYNRNPVAVASPNKVILTPTHVVNFQNGVNIKTSTPVSNNPEVLKDISTEEWNRLQELKLKQDEVLYGVKVIDPVSIYGKTKRNEPMINENIYESAEKLQNINSPQMANNFIRSPQRNTIGSIYRNRIQSQAIIPRPLSPQIIQPPRSQSVLDNITNRNYVENISNYGLINNNGPLPLQRDRSTSQASIISKEEVRNQIREFCFRSMSKSSNKDKNDLSPVSYSSIDSREVQSKSLQRPQVINRGGSLSVYSPIYLNKRHSLLSSNNSIIEESYTKPQRQVSETDSVFLPKMSIPQRPVPQQGRQRFSSADIYGQLYSQQIQNEYNAIHQNDDQIGLYSVPRPYPVMRPVSAMSTSNVRYTSDGRGTPLILYSIPRSPQKIVIRPNKNAIKPVYRKIIQSNAIPVHIQNSPQKYIGAPYESDTGSEAGEVQRIMQNRNYLIEEDWQNEKGVRGQQTEQATDDRRRAARSREDPRRHTLGGDMLHYGGQGPPQRTMDLEMGTRSQKSKKAMPVRGYVPVNQGPLFDDDPGIMSEVETASTGFRRGGKQRSSLPVVRTPSKTLERPLGLVFLQYRSETKRALLPNEITSIDTVRALFVRSFPRQLTMTYLEGPNVKIYIHDASKDMFYELEDVRSHLREIRDRSVLRLFESNEVVAPQALPGGPGIPQPLPPSGVPGHWDQDQSYFSEPEFDSEFQHQHIHKSKGGKGAPYYVGSAQTLPRGMYTDRNKNTIGAPTKPLRSYGSSMGPPFPYPDQLYSIPDGYMSSPERGTRGSYEEPYYSQYGTRGGTVTPIIDEEQSDASQAEDQYSLYGVKVSGRIPRGANQMYDPTRPEDLHRMRIEHMERQLANLTGVVQKALTHNPIVGQIVNPNLLGVPGQCRSVPDEIDGHSSSSSTSIQDKSVSFEKSVSFSDDIQGVQKSHQPQHPERDRMKPPPPPKPLGLAPSHQNYRPDIALAPEVYNQLRGLQKKAKDLRTEVRTLRRISQAQAVAVREDIKDTFMRIRATLLSSSGCYWGQGDQETITRLSREEELYKQEAVRLEKDLGDLENSVESLRTEVINRRTRVNMSSVEDMALVLSRASKTVAELKMKYPALESGLRNILNNEMEKIIQEEKFMKDEPMRLESALRRCKKLTGTLVTLKRLASVQEQRLPSASDPPPPEDIPRSAEVQSTNKPVPSPRMGTITVGGGTIAPENALDALLDELQTFAKPTTHSSNNEQRPDDSTSDDSSQTLQNNNTVTIQLSQSSLYHPNDSNPIVSSGGGVHHQTHGLRRLHSYPSGSDTDTSPPQAQRPSSGKPPVPERNAELLNKVNSNKRVPPPPPPRTSSRSPLASPTSPNVPIRLQSVSENQNIDCLNLNQNLENTNNSSSSESVNSQDHMQRQIALELRHQELLKKQKQLQEQYVRLQQISKNNVPLQPNEMLQLKKTGSESNLPQKMGLNMTVSGSSKNLRNSSTEINCNNFDNQNNDVSNSDNSSTTSMTTSTTNKVYETDIL